MSLRDDGRQCKLIVHEISYQYVKSSIVYIANILNTEFTQNFSLEIVSTVEEVDVSDIAWVFVVGDPFDEFVRNEYSHYIFINFSLVYEFEGIVKTSIEAKEWIQKKHELFMKKLHCFDTVLDYFPIQTAIMQKELAAYPVNVFSFPVNTVKQQEARIPILERLYDVCIVGSLSARRKEIHNLLESNDLYLSPVHTKKFPEIIRNSKVVINIHVQQSNNVELPRIIETLQMGSCLLTEKCLKLSDVISSECYCESNYADLLTNCLDLINNPMKIAQYERSSLSYMSEIYNPRSDEMWKTLIASIENVEFQTKNC